jgi:sugar lactone lactonase YvrE
MVTMRQTLLTLTGIAVVAAGMTVHAGTNKYGCDESYRPRLFKQFGAVANVPDGLSQDADGNIYCSAPNFKDPNHAATILKYDRKSGEWFPFVAALRHPDTGMGAPMGLEFCPDGHIYYADNQYFSDKNYKSRIMRVTVVDGEAQVIEPVVENIKLANAVRVRGNALYFSDTFGDIKERHEGYVYRVPFSAFAEGKVAKLLPKEQAASDPYCLGITQTIPFGVRKDIAGADGLAFDRDGNLYTGNFGDGCFYMIPMQKDGSYGKMVELVRDLNVISCVDGLYYYEKKNWVLIADSEKNAIRYWDVSEQKMKLLWENDDVDGSDGLLDQPCEIMVWQDTSFFGLIKRDKLIVVNFDWTFPGLRNAGGDESKNDKVYTISIIDL